MIAIPVLPSPTGGTIDACPVLALVALVISLR